jgi:hypothetical protein
MAIKYLVGLDVYGVTDFHSAVDFNQQEVQNMQIQNYAGDPNGVVTGVAGQILFDSVAKVLYTCDAAGTVWHSAGADTNTATATDNILDGSNIGTAITYAPYAAQQAGILSFDTSSTTPTRTDRLNLNGKLYTTDFVTNSIAGFTTLSVDSATTSALNIGTGANAKTITIGNNTTTTAIDIITGSGNLDITSPLVTISGDLTVTGGDIKTGAAVASTLFSDTTTGNIAIAGTLSSGTYTVGATGSTGAVSLFPATGSQAITLGGATTGVVTIGGGANTMNIGATGANTINIGSASSTAVILPTGKAKIGQTILAQGDAQTYTFPSSGAGATLIASSGTQTIATGLTITDVIEDNIKASGTAIAADLWSEITTGSIAIGAGFTTGTMNIDAASTDTHTANFATGATASAKTKTVNIGTAGVAASTGTLINIGPVLGPNTITIGQSTAAETVNIGTGATLSATTKAINIGTNAVTASTSTNIAVGPTAGPDTITIGQSVAAETINIGTGSTGSAVTRTVNIGTVSAGSSINNINIGGGSGTTAIKLPSLGTSGLVGIGTGGLLSGVTTLGTGLTITDPIIDNIKASGINVAADLWSEVTTGSIAIGAGLSSGSITLGAGTGNTTVSNNLVVTGNMTVNGTTTTTNSTTVTYDDPILTLGGDTSAVEVTKDRGIEAKWNGTTITMTNYIGNGTTTVTGTTASTTGWAAGDIITISGATGTEQTKLNGTWTLASVPTGATFTFVVLSTVSVGTLTTTLGTMVKSKNAFFGLDQSTGKFTFIPQANNVSEVFSGTKGTIDAYVEWADINSKPTVTAKYAIDLTASATSYVITHNLNTQDAVVSVRELATPWAQVMCDVEFTSVNTVTLRFTSAPTGSTYRVTVIG